MENIHLLCLLKHTHFVKESKLFTHGNQNIFMKHKFDKFKFVKQFEILNRLIYFEFKFYLF